MLLLVWECAPHTHLCQVRETSNTARHPRIAAGCSSRRAQLARYLSLICPIFFDCRPYTTVGSSPLWSSRPRPKASSLKTTCQHAGAATLCRVVSEPTELREAKA